VFVGVEDEVDAISPFELVQNSVEVSHDGRITDEQFRGDLGVVASCDETIGHRAFTRSAQLNVMWICDVPAGRLHERLDQSHRDFRRHLRTAVGCRTDAEQDLLWWCVFEEKPDPRLDALVALLVLDGLKMGEALALNVGDVSGRSPRMSVIVRRRDETSRVDLDKDSARAVRRCVTQRPSRPLPTGRTSNTSARVPGLPICAASGGTSSVPRSPLKSRRTQPRSRRRHPVRKEAEMPLDESLPDPEQHPLLPDAIDAAADLGSQPAVALHALQVLEYALTAPAPRRHRTWLHRVSTALDALRSALDTQLHAHQDSIDLLAELASGEPDHAIPIEPDPVITIVAGEIKDRLARIANRFRQHQAVEADLVYQATGIELDEPLSPH
jgi:hypothetical protein